MAKMMLAARGPVKFFGRTSEANAVSKPAVNNFVQALIAVVVGNAVYFLLMPHLPPAARHAPFKTDIGLAVDFWFCLVVFGLVKTAAARKRHSRSTDH
jgi:hypothetical protein